MKPEKHLVFLAVLFGFCFLTTAFFRVASINHGLPSSYVEDIQIKNESYNLWQMQLSGHSRSQLTSQHKYSLLSNEFVALWANFYVNLFKSHQVVDRSDFIQICRTFVVLMSFLFIFLSFGLGEGAKTRLIAGSLASVLFLPFLFSLMTRPHLINAAFLMAVVVMGKSLVCQPARWKIILLGLLSGLAISVIFPSLLTLWFAALIFKKKKLWVWSPWYLVGLFAGLLPGHLDAVILIANPDWQRVFNPDQMHVDWLQEFRLRQFSFEGFPVMARTFLGYDPFLTLGCLVGIAFCRLNDFEKVCLWTLVPLLIFLGLMSLNFPRFWLLVYPFVLVLSVRGWFHLLGKGQGSTIFITLAFLLALSLQIRTSWLMHHDTRPLVEKNVLALVPDNSILLLEDYGARFNNYPKDKRPFEVIRFESFSKETKQMLKETNKHIFYLTPEISGESQFGKKIFSHVSLVKKWEYPGDPKHTRSLPNHMPFPWLSAWRRSWAGPNHYLYLVDPQAFEGG